MYFNWATKEIEEPEKIILKEIIESDMSEKNVAVPRYVIEMDQGNFKAYAYNDISLLYNLVTNLDGLRKMVVADIRIKTNEDLYPEKDPAYISERIIRLHNQNLSGHCQEIERANPFTLKPKRVLTLKQARELANSS